MEPEIAPLAKRLAEENNVNWRALSGSGANGRILERDVLEYLARVMAGEEDINPTAEPLPEGLDAWPEDDVKTYYGVDTSTEVPDFVPDIDDASLFVDAAEPVTSGDDGLGDDIFLVDEGDFSVSPTASHEPIQYDASLDSAEEDISDVYGSLTLDEMGVDLSAAAEPESIFDDSASDAFDVSDEEPLAMFEGSDSEDASLTTQSFEAGLPDFEEPLDEAIFASETTTQAPESFADTESLFVDEVEPVQEAFAALVAEPDAFEDAPVIEESVFAVSEQEPEMLSASYDTTDEIEDASFEVMAPEQNAQHVFLEDAVSEETSHLDAADTTQGLQSDVWAEHQSEVESAGESTPHHWSASTADTSWSEPVPDPVVDTITPLATVAAAATLGAIHNEGAPVPANLPLVTYGILLRRHADLSTLVQAQHAVSEEIGYEDPRTMTCFLLRAAAKALHKVPLVQGGVGLASIQAQGVGIMAIPEASSASFRSVLSRTHAALGEILHQDRVGLAVADMSGFDIDEAVLNVGIPVLTLGRMMYDNSKGTHHSTLSISGNVSVESGTKFLSAVAELLDSPVRLVV